MSGSTARSSSSSGKGRGIFRAWWNADEHNGGSQAVRLPAEFRFDGLDEVYIRRDTVTGDVILSAQRLSTAWSDFFALRDGAEVQTEFMNDRPLNKALKARKIRECR